MALTPTGGVAASVPAAEQLRGFLDRANLGRYHTPVRVPPSDEGFHRRFRIFHSNVVFEWRMQLTNPYYKSAYPRFVTGP